MNRYFNITGACDPQRHYMVDIQDRLLEIKKMVDRGEYFTINRARQYGKTTTLQALANYLKENYVVLSLDFQMIGNSRFAAEHSFSIAFTEYLLETIQDDSVCGLDDALLDQLRQESISDERFALDNLFRALSRLCNTAKKPVVLMIDEVDGAADHQVFLDFLAQLRAYYLARRKKATFQSVILAGVYDIKNLKHRVRSEKEHKVNSPWNIAARFRISMSFSEDDIRKMLKEYETDHNTGMDTEEIACLLFAYTSGYPFLVSRLCKIMDEELADSSCSAWNKEKVLEAVNLLLAEKNTLFESLIGKLLDYPDLAQKLFAILFGGQKLIYNPDDPYVDIAVMFGFVKNDGGTIAIANRIFEVRLYNYFLTSTAAQNSEIFLCASDSKSSFIKNGRLDMDCVLKKFVEHFRSIYGERPEEFDEEEGRRRFLLYLRPIINGTGNYYIEAQTRNLRRMDVVVDYGGEQFIIELKIWRGNAYHERGEQQLADYLDYFHLKKGYMLSYCFNQKKETGVKEICVGERILIEAIV